MLGFLRPWQQGRVQERERERERREREVKMKMKKKRSVLEEGMQSNGSCKNKSASHKSR